MYQVKYITRDKSTLFRNYKNRTYEQVRAIASNSYKKGWIWVSIAKVY